jgi:murein L,D-transpeptidase YcbB/YkuD
MRTCGILFFLTFSVFAQEPDFHYKGFSIKVDSVTSGVEVRKIQAVLALEKDPGKLVLLQKAVQDYRWLDALRAQKKVIIVNIPSASMRVFHGIQEVLHMKVIVGKKSKQTRTLLSKIDELTINPYWFVTPRMAREELLPKIKRNIEFLDNNQIQVLNSKYRVIDPNSIDWLRLNKNNFPYILRQNSGENNALGAIKFHFNNPYSLYLHDTDSKKLFKQPQRFYSHGCIRLEKPKDLARLLLGENHIALDTVKFNHHIKNPKPLALKAKEEYILVIWYSQVDFDAKGELLYFKDVYR